MKKILTVSLFAIMAVSAANAEIASTQYVTDRTGNLQFSDTGATKDAKTLTEAVVALDEQFSITSGGVGTLTTDVASLQASVETITGSLSATGTTGKSIAAAQAQADKGVADAAAAKQAADAAQEDANANADAISKLDTTYVSETEIADYTKTADMNSAIATAKSEAISEAATDAQSKADAALAAAKEDAKQYIDATELKASQDEQDVVLKKYADDAAAAVGTAASGALSTKLADYSTTEQMNSAIAAADTALETSLKSYADKAEEDAIAAAKTAGDTAYAVKGTEDVASGNTAAINTINTNLGGLAGIKIPAACATGRCALVMENNQAKWETINY